MGGRRVRMPWWLPGALCLAISLAVTVACMRVTGSGRVLLPVTQTAGESSQDESVAEAGTPDAGVSEEGEGIADAGVQGAGGESPDGGPGEPALSGQVKGLVDGLSSDDVICEGVSADTFLDELGQRAESSDEPEMPLAWRSDDGLVTEATAVLEAYQDTPTAQLRVSGYLDLKGRAWGAIVQDARGWVDVVVVHAASDGSWSEVRLVRMQGGVEEETDDAV